MNYDVQDAIDALAESTDDLHANVTSKDVIDNFFGVKAIGIASTSIDKIMECRKKIVESIPEKNLTRSSRSTLVIDNRLTFTFLDMKNDSLQGYTFDSVWML